MNTSACLRVVPRPNFRVAAMKDQSADVRATDVEFVNVSLLIQLDDGRKIGLPLFDVPWLQWLAKATPDQRANWSLEPGGYAVYWEDLDDGIEISHLLSRQPI